MSTKKPTGPNDSVSVKRRKRPNYSSAERRQRQDIQAFMLYLLFGIVALAAAFWPSASAICRGALQGALGPLVIITLRYVLRITTGHRRDFIGILSAALFVILFFSILICVPPLSFWNAPIVFLGLVATVIGIHRFRLTPIFMLLNCMIAGAIIL